MEQTQNLPAFTTQLASLPSILDANSSLAERAVAKVVADIAPLKAIDLTTVDVQTMEQHDQTLATLQGKLKESYNLMNERRKPFTQLFDELKSKFTAEEKKVVAIGEEVKAIRDGWQREKGRRNQVALEAQQKELERKQALIDVKTYIKSCIVDNFAIKAVETIKRMHSKFYAQAADALDAYTDALAKWQPALDNDTWNSFLQGIINQKPQLLSQGQMQDLLNEVVEEQRPKLASEWVVRMSAERNGLVELKESRKMELERIAGDAAAAEEARLRIEREQAEREAQARQDAADRAAAAATEADVEKMNSAFDVAAEGSPVVDIAKGTVVKKKYNPKSHKAWAAIMQSWVKNDMAGYTLEELAKKLSFMKTACESRLNKGEELQADGLTIEEDYSTRASRKKEVA